MYIMLKEITIFFFKYKTVYNLYLEYMVTVLNFGISDKMVDICKQGHKNQMEFMFS